MRNVLENILEICFPDHCVGCRTKGTLLCELCIQKTRHPERDLPRNIKAACDYRDPQIKRALHFLKYYKKKRLGTILGAIVYERLLEDIADIRMYTLGSPILLIPVPLSKQRKRVRGYNQALEIARGIDRYATEHTQESLFEINTIAVEKIKDTKQQAKIKNRKERLQNLKNCFHVKNPTQIHNRTIIVIDDITTTGSTLKELITVLTNAGAKKVVGFAVAH